MPKPENKKPIIAVDIDDVLSSQNDVLIRFSNERFGTNLTQDDFKKPGDYWGYYEQLWDVSKEEGTRRFKEFLDAKRPLTQVISPETINVLELLKKRFRLEIVTSRGSDYQEGTVQWLDVHAPKIFEGVHFTVLWNTGDEVATKALICNKIGASYLIDDNAEHCNLAAEAGVTSLLFGDFGWNIHEAIHEKVTRVKDWQAVAEYFGV